MLNIYEAGELGIDRAVKLLDATLQEEKKTDAANSACGHGHQPYG
jgi:ferritin-like metal-binding protein YciE